MRRHYCALNTTRRELRRARTNRHRQFTSEVVKRLAPDLSGRRRDDVVEAVMLACSSTALFEYLDVLGLDMDRAARVSARIVRALLQHPDS